MVRLKVETLFNHSSLFNNKADWIVLILLHLFFYFIVSCIVN